MQPKCKVNRGKERESGGPICLTDSTHGFWPSECVWLWWERRLVLGASDEATCGSLLAHRHIQRRLEFRAFPRFSRQNARQESDMQRAKAKGKTMRAGSTF